MNLSRTVYEINGDFSRKSLIRTYQPRVLKAPAEGVPIGIWYRRKGSKTRMMGLSDGQKGFKVWFSRLDTIQACDWQTDGHRTTAKTARVTSQCFTLKKAMQPVWAPESVRAACTRV